MGGGALYYFVGGYARTGTTLVGNLLCGDPSTNPPLSEITYVEYMMFPYEAMMKGWDSNYWNLFDDLDEFQEFHKGIIECFFLHLMDKHHCSKLVMKRPFLTKWFPVLSRWFREARFIVVVRDPRDVAGSLKRVKKKHFQADLNQQDLNPFLDVPLIDMVHDYVRSVDMCIRAAKEFPGQWHFVKYEELVTFPEKSCKCIGDALGLELSLEKDQWEEQAWKPENPFHSRDWGKPITTANIGKYKTQLNDEELEMVEMLASGLMEVFDYV